MMHWKKAHIIYGNTCVVNGGNQGLFYESLHSLREQQDQPTSWL